LSAGISAVYHKHQQTIQALSVLLRWKMYSSLFFSW